MTPSNRLRRLAAHSGQDAYNAELLAIADELERVVSEPVAEDVKALRDGFAAGVAAAAAWVDARRQAFDEEHGRVDPDTGFFEYGRGAHAEAKREYSAELEDIAEAIKAITPPIPATSPAKDQ